MFEVNQTVYDNEIDLAMDVVVKRIYAAKYNINRRANLAQQMVTTLNDEIEDYTDQYQQRMRLRNSHR